ncbi:MAG: serine/threonine-protein kinase, partial [Phycisphaerae bacterium]
MSAQDPDQPHVPDPPDPRTLIQSQDLVRESLQRSVPDASGQDPDAPAVPGYVLRELIGEGAYGQVWRAWQLRTRKEVAVKVFTQTSGLDWIFLQREVERLTRLDRHPHIVTLLDANLTGDPPFYAMDLIEGGSLQQFVNPDHTASKKRVVRWMEQLCEAMQYVHAKGLLHCDLKPANILIDGQDNVRVCDFGQSRVFTDTGTSFGTLFYMAPEQATLATEDRAVHPDVRWDIYALGATLHAVLAGHAPRATAQNIAKLDAASTLDERLETYRRLCRTDPPWTPVGNSGNNADPRRHQPEPTRKNSGDPAARVDRELAAVVGMCLATVPVDRYKTMAGVLRDVAAIKQCRPVSPLAGSVVYRAKKHVQRNPVRLGLAVAL